MMTSDSGETKKDDSPEPLGDRWLICPICKQPNPAGTEYCKYCWGASLHQVVPITKHEADDFAKQWVKIKKRRRIMRISFLVLVPIILLLGMGFLYIYSYTDLLFGPVSQMNSNSRADDWAMFRNNLDRSGSAATSLTQHKGKYNGLFRQEEKYIHPRQWLTEWFFSDPKTINFMPLMLLQGKCTGNFKQEVLSIPHLL